MVESPETTNVSSVDSLYQRISFYLYQAKQNVLRSIDTELLKAYWNIGREIVEEEQKGVERAEYGKAILQQLSERLMREFGRGYGKSTLADIRKFYLTYSKGDAAIVHALRGQSDSDFRSSLSWTHYRLLMRISTERSRNS